MKKNKTWISIIAIMLLAIGLTYLNIWIIHWAVSLFYPISMWQAFGLSVLLTMISSAFRGSRVKSNL